MGLVRIEFIISEFIKIHPLALVHYPNIALPGDQQGKVRKEIEKRTYGYSRKSEYFVDKVLYPSSFILRFKLAEGIGQIAAAFYPKEVIVRTSDFKTNEYANLLGGQAFEPREENPMLGKSFAQQS